MSYPLKSQGNLKGGILKRERKGEKKERVNLCAYKNYASTREKGIQQCTKNNVPQNYSIQNPIIAIANLTLVPKNERKRL